MSARVVRLRRSDYVVDAAAQWRALARRPRFVMSYTPNMACPGCAGGHWEIGRSTAECPRCGFAIDLPAPGGRA